MRRWLLLVIAFLPIAASPQLSLAVDEVGESPIPVLAYYYIWFEETSWDRAKADYPSLGRYTSDDGDVMRQHVLWAKEAGIDGFIVSWKSTLPLDRRLEQLIQIATDEDFKLAIIYQGLDFHRAPQPIERVAADIDHFITTYAHDPVFDIIGGPPIIIWSGTWEFTADEIARVTGTRSLRSGCDWTSDIDPTCVQILATERNLDGVQRLAGLVDGNAYYWSSVNPDTYPGYPEKLIAMRDAVKETDGLWIAPAAPGFDARMIGGTTVERRDGETLRRQLDAALASSPDAVGLISWNEFTENSHVEPSEVHGTTALSVLADVAGGRPPSLPDIDSSEPGTAPRPSRPSDDLVGRAMILGLFVGAIGIGSLIIARRQRSAPVRPPRSR